MCKNRLRFTVGVRADPLRKAKECRSCLDLRYPPCISTEESVSSEGLGRQGDKSAGGVMTPPPPIMGSCFCKQWVSGDSFQNDSSNLPATRAKAENYRKQ